MERINKLKDILQRKTKLNNSRYLEVNINEISRSDWHKKIEEM